jgi:hypothetical protein
MWLLPGMTHTSCASRTTVKERGMKCPQATEKHAVGAAEHGNTRVLAIRDDNYIRGGADACWVRKLPSANNAGKVKVRRQHLNAVVGAGRNKDKVVK